jgi:hypothetical protein
MEPLEGLGQDIRPPGSFFTRKDILDNLYVRPKNLEINTTYSSMAMTISQGAST